MKIGIMSDSHDNLKMVDMAVKIFLERGVQHVFHAGDIIAPFVVDSLKKLGRGVPVTAVFGNNDGEKLFLIKRFEEIGSIREGNIFTSF
jgi:putative phosphoesterase